MNRKIAPSALYFPCAVFSGGDDRWKLWCTCVPDSRASQDGTEWVHADDLKPVLGKSIYVGVVDKTLSPAFLANAFLRDNFSPSEITDEQLAVRRAAQTKE